MTTISDLLDQAEHIDNLAQEADNSSGSDALEKVKIAEKEYLEWYDQSLKLLSDNYKEIFIKLYDNSVSIPCIKNFFSKLVLNNQNQLRNEIVTIFSSDSYIGAFKGQFSAQQNYLRMTQNMQEGTENTDDVEWATGRTIVDRLQNALEQDEISKKYYSASAKDLPFEEWKTYLVTILNPQNPYAKFFLMNFPEWLKETFHDRIEIRHSSSHFFEVWIDEQWIGQFKFYENNPVYVYLNLFEVQKEIAKISEMVSPTSEFKRGPANRQTKTALVYTFWINKNQDYEALKEIITQIAERVERPWSQTVLTRERIIEELEKFDREERADKGLDGWYNWENSSRVTGGKYKYAIRYNGQLYPPRRIYQAAGGKDDSTTEVARRNLIKIGFEVITLDNLVNNPWPSQVDGPCFVLMHQHEDQWQRYGETFAFNLKGGAGRKDLYEALQAQKAGGMVVSVIIYLPGTHPLTGRPHKAFTAWARVKDWEPATEGDTNHVIMNLEHHEFPVPLYIKGNGAVLVDKLDWLHTDLSKTFWQRPIRKISDSDFKSIIEEAKKANVEEMNLGDAAYAVLFEATGPLPLPEIIEQVVKRGLVNQPPKATDLANELLDDTDRFMSVGENRWDLINRSLEPALPDGFERLQDYWEFVDTLQMGQGYTTEEIYKLAGGANPDTNPESFMMGLRQLRLMRYNPTASRYELQPYATSEGIEFQEQETAILRLMALGLLVAERADEKFSLPAREILPRLKNAAGPQPAASFAPELKWENEKLLGWYAEAGLVSFNPIESEWEVTATSLEELPGSAPTTIAYNELLNALRQSYIEQAAIQAESFGPLSQVEHLQEKIKELQKTVLVDDQTVLRIYRSLLAGRNVILSGPPGTGKTLLAEKLPEILWRQERHEVLPDTDLDDGLVLDRSETIHGYRAVFVTATEDWSVRDVIGGISPRLGGSDGDGKMSYDIRYGALTGTVLKNYQFTDEGKKLPVDTNAPQRDFVSEGSQRYLGAWLVIDEFNRAHIDAAFGSLLTTLSGKVGATLAVPARGSDVTELKMPRDFRIIGTLNSFDRHFLNQISEALKRRFDFIDILPPRPDRYKLELVISMQGALKHLHDNAFSQIQINSEGYYTWPGVIEFIEEQGVLEPFYDNSEAEAAIQNFQRIFAVIRFFRKLGTAQVVAVLSNLFTGVLVGMTWPVALDLALADTLADQLQVLTPDEQMILESYLTHAGDVANFGKEVREQLPGHKVRRSRVVNLLREADILHNNATTIELQNESHPTDSQLNNLFKADKLLGLQQGYFLRRLRDLNTDRGI